MKAMTRLSFSLEEEVYDAVKLLAALRRVTVSELMRSLVAAALRERSGDEGKHVSQIFARANIGIQTHRSEEIDG